MSALDVPAAAAAGTERILAHILPSTIVVFCAYFSIGMPLSVVPPYVHGTLGLGTIAVGAMIGLQSLASVLTRPWSGILSDTRGAKTAINLGLAACPACSISSPPRRYGRRSAALPRWSSAASRSVSAKAWS
jgi:MFS family permease